MEPKYICEPCGRVFAIKGKCFICGVQNEPLKDQLTRVK